MPRSPRFFVVVLAATVQLLAGAGAAQAHRPTVVGPGDSIQAAVDAAAPGDRIVVHGTHRENVAIQTDGLTLRGRGAVILPPAVPVAHACFDPGEVGEAVHGICLIGDVDFATGEIRRYVEDVTVRGFTVRGFDGFGFTATAARRATFTGNVAVGNTDAGINAGQSFDTRIRRNDLSGSRFGIFLS